MPTACAGQIRVTAGLAGQPVGFLVSLPMKGRTRITGIVILSDTL